MKKTAGFILILNLLGGLLCGCTNTHHIFDVLDGPGMVNTNGPLEYALAGTWESSDGKYKIDIDSYMITFFMDGEQLLTDDFYFNFNGDDISAYTELELYNNQLTRNGTETLGYIDNLFSQDGTLTATLVWADNKREEVLFSIHSGVEE